MSSGLAKSLCTPHGPNATLLSSPHGGLSPMVLAEHWRFAVGHGCVHGSSQIGSVLHMGSPARCAVHCFTVQGFVFTFEESFRNCTCFRHCRIGDPPTWNTDVFVLNAAVANATTLA